MIGFRKNVDKNISEEEYLTIVEPFNNLFKEYLATYHLPDLCAYYLASAYRTNAEWESSLKSHINSILAIINCEQFYSDLLIDKITDILRIKYCLIIVNTNPLEFKEVIF